MAERDGAVSAPEGHRPLSVAVVGAGWGGRYLQALERHPLADVVAVCASTEKSARRLAGSSADRRWYTDYERMFEVEEIEAAVIATPNDLHHPIAMCALEHGAHVMCEKPLALDLPQAQEMAGVASRLARVTIVPFTWRFFPSVVKLKELIDEGVLGDLYHARISYLTRGLGEVHGEARWQHDITRAGSGVLANLGSHAVAIARWLFGDLTRVSAVGHCAVDERRAGNGGYTATSCDDTFSMLAELEGGSPLVIETGWVAFIDRVRLEITACGSAATLELKYDSGEDGPGRLGRLTRGTADLARPQRVEIPPRLLGGAAWDDIASDAARCIVDEHLAAISQARAASPDFAEGLEVQRVIAAALASASSRQWVDVLTPDAGRART